MNLVLEMKLFKNKILCLIYTMIVYHRNLHDEVLLHLLGSHRLEKMFFSNELHIRHSKVILLISYLSNCCLLYTSRRG